MKRSLVAAAALCAAMAPSASLAQYGETGAGGAPATFASAPRSGPIIVRINEHVVNFRRTQPLWRNGRILVPLRGVLTGTPGFALTWDPVRAIVSAAYLDRSVQLKIGSHTAFINGRQTSLDVPALTIRGRTMVPLRFLSEALGAVVSWFPVSRVVTVNTVQPVSAMVQNGVASAYNDVNYRRGGIARRMGRANRRRKIVGQNSTER